MLEEAGSEEEELGLESRTVIWDAGIPSDISSAKHRAKRCRPSNGDQHMDLALEK